MISALYRYPASRRREVARIWGKRGLEAQARQRQERGVDFETLQWRAKEDRRGKIVKEGFSIVEGTEVHWQVRHSIFGRSDQFDLVANGKVHKVCGKRKLPKRFRP